MTLLQELEAAKGTRNGNLLVDCFDGGLNDAITHIRAFADKLEGEEMVEKAYKAFRNAYSAALHDETAGADECDKRGIKAALAVVIQQIRGEK